MIHSLVWNSLLMIHEYLLLFTRKFDNSFPDKKIPQKSFNNNNRPQMMVVNNNNQYFDYHEKWLYFQKKNVTQNNLLDYTPILGDFFYHFCTTEYSTSTTQRFSNSDSVPSSLRQDQYTALYTVGQNTHKNAIYQKELYLSRSMFWNF